MAMLHGYPDQAETHARAALDIGVERGQLDALTVFGAQLIIVRWQQGRLDELSDLLTTTAAQNPAIPGFAAASALERCESGDENVARQLLNELAAHGLAVVPHDPSWLTTIHLYSELAIQLHDRPAARLLSAELEPWRDRIDANAGLVTGPAAHFLGALATVLGRYGQAERFFLRAAELNERMGARFFGARTNLEWGKMLLARATPGDLERGRELLSLAMTAAQEHGYAMIERRAKGALGS